MTARRHPGTRSLRRAGVVLPAVLVLVFTVCLVVALVTSFSVRSMRLVRRTLDVQRAFVVAESGLAYGVKRVQAIINNEKIAGIRAKYDTIAAPATPQRKTATKRRSSATFVTDAIALYPIPWARSFLICNACSSVMKSPHFLNV